MNRDIINAHDRRSSERRSRNVRLVLHIGTEKTATTHIQQALASNRSALRRSGVRYPRVFGEASWGHHNLGWWLKGRRRRIRRPTPLSILPPSLAWRLLGHSRSHVVMSSEVLANLRPAEWGRLLEGTRATPEIVLFLRRRDEFVASLWRQRARHGAVDDLLSFVEKLVARRRSPVDYLRLVRELAGLVGPGGLHLVDYDRMRSAGRDPTGILTTEVLRVPGRVERPSSGQANASLTFEQAEILRRLQRIDVSETNPMGWRRVTRRFESVDATNAIDGLRRERNTALRLDEQFAADDDVLLDEFGDRFIDPDGNGHSPTALFAAPGTEPSAVPVFAPDAGAAAIADLYAAMRSRHRLESWRRVARIRASKDR